MHVLSLSSDTANTRQASPRPSLRLDPLFNVTRPSRVHALDSLKVHLSRQFSVA